MDWDINVNLGSGYAGPSQPVTDVNSLADKITGIGNVIIVLLIFVAVIWIVWSAVRLAMNDGDGRKEIRGHLIWGVVGLAVILSLWGLVNILMNTFGLGNYGSRFDSRRDVGGLIIRPSGQQGTSTIR